MCFLLEPVVPLWDSPLTVGPSLRVRRVLKRPQWSLTDEVVRFYHENYTSEDRFG